MDEEAVEMIRDAGSRGGPLPANLLRGKWQRELRDRLEDLDDEEAGEDQPAKNEADCAGDFEQKTSTDSRLSGSGDG